MVAQFLFINPPTSSLDVSLKLRAPVGRFCASPCARLRRLARLTPARQLRRAPRPSPLRRPPRLTPGAQLRRSGRGSLASSQEAHPCAGAKQFGASVRRKAGTPLPFVAGRWRTRSVKFAGSPRAPAFAAAVLADEVRGRQKCRPRQSSKRRALRAALG